MRPMTAKQSKYHGLFQPSSFRRAICIFALCAASAATLASAQVPTPAPATRASPIPDEFVDPETHLRVLHLSRVPNDRSGVIYFTYPSFSADSRYSLIDVQFQDKWRFLYSFDFAERKVIPLETTTLTQNQVVCAKSGNVYFQTASAAWVVNIKGGTPRKIADLPERWAPGIGFSVNADETLLLGGSTDTEKAVAATMKPADVQKGPNVLFTINIASGEVKVIHRGNDWFGHVQFSPTDPDLLMFCHEGNWEVVDRIWLMSLGKNDPHIAYKRTEPREIVGHEFWQPDGKAIWFQQSFRADPQRGGFLSTMDLATGKVTQYKIPAGFGGIHETWSPDGTFLVADGNGKGKTGPNKYLSQLWVKDGKITGRHLCSLQDNDYAIEPNPHVSPDNRWVTFTATLHGTPQAYAVELPEK